ncbi:MAG: hypothetical protein IJ678_04060 [Kiritimatiellae bacterium]|nr:hypothetical protein [Kiritimatiellia bacterium]
MNKTIVRTAFFASAIFCLTGCKSSAIQERCSGESADAPGNHGFRIRMSNRHEVETLTVYSPRNVDDEPDCTSKHCPYFHDETSRLVRISGKDGAMSAEFVIARDGRLESVWVQNATARESFYIISVPETDSWIVEIKEGNPPSYFMASFDPKDKAKMFDPSVIEFFFTELEKNPSLSSIHDFRSYDFEN